MKHLLLSMLLILPIFLFSTPSFPDDDNGGEKSERENLSHESNEKDKSEKEKSEKKGEPSNFGPEKGVLEANEKEGIKLSPKALQSLGIKAQSISSTSVHSLPISSLIYFQDEVGVYRLRSGFFKLIEGKVSRKTQMIATFESGGLVPGDQVVTEGTPLLRLTDLNIWSGSGDGDAD